MTVCFLISSSKRNEHEFLMKWFSSILYGDTQKRPRSHQILYAMALSLFFRQLRNSPVHFSIEHSICVVKVASLNFSRLNTCSLSVYNGFPQKVTRARLNLQWSLQPFPMYLCPHKMEEPMKSIDIFGPRREPIFPCAGFLRSLSDGLQYVISGCVVAASGLS
jgi:hypothetical protein